MLLAGRRQEFLPLNCSALSTGGHFASCCCPLLPGHTCQDVAVL